MTATTTKHGAGLSRRKKIKKDRRGRKGETRDSEDHRRNQGDGVEGKGKAGRKEQGTKRYKDETREKCMGQGRKTEPRTKDPRTA